MGSRLTMYINDMVEEPDVGISYLFLSFSFPDQKQMVIIRDKSKCG